MIEELVFALEQLLATLERADVREGYCCCGDSMEFHARPMDAGHEPVDAGEYFAWRNIEYAKEVLKKVNDNDN